MAPSLCFASNEVTEVQASEPSNIDRRKFSTELGRTSQAPN
jgi:hypothetical protein